VKAQSQEDAPMLLKSVSLAVAVIVTFTLSGCADNSRQHTMGKGMMGPNMGCSMMQPQTAQGGDAGKGMSGMSGCSMMTGAAGAAKAPEPKAPEGEDHSAHHPPGEPR
jgi:hypothetical protein